jgi:PKD repeat protein
MKAVAVPFVLIVLVTGLFFAGLDDDNGDLHVFSTVERVFADPAGDDGNHPPEITVQMKNDSGVFENVPDTVTTHEYIDTEWRVILEDPDGDAVSVYWFFSDGFDSTSQYVNHSFEYAGDHFIDIQAFDGNETNGRVEMTVPVIVEPNAEPVGVINITAPAIDWVTLPKTSPRYRGLEARVNKGDTIAFDASGSYDPEGQPLTSFKWEFDDLYATEDNPNVTTLARASHRFLVEGSYNVTITLFDGVQYGWANVWIHTNNPPIAVMKGEIITETKEEILFDGSRCSDPDGEDRLQYRWDFGDGTRTDWSDSAYAMHTYNILATYIVTLWVTDGLLTESTTTIAIINPKTHPPVAVAGIQEEHLWTNMSLHFSSNGSHDIDGEGRISFIWDFDDGTDPSTLANPVHAYEEPGTYNVTLTVIDANDLFARDTLNITVELDYGDTDVVIEALDPTSHLKFLDPPKDDIVRLAVARDGWVAYRCDLKADYKMVVHVTIIGDRPADVYLFTEDNFQAYREEPPVDHVAFEAGGSEQGVLGEFRYSFEPNATDSYYIVIDNKDWPTGTETEGPADYTISIEPRWFIPHHPFYDDDTDYLLVFVVPTLVTAVLAVFLIWLALNRHRGK